MDRLRGRVRLLDDAADRPHLGPMRMHPCDPGPWTLPPSHLDCSPDLLQAGERSRLIYRPRRDGGRRDGRKSFAWTDYRDLLIIAHQQLGGPIVLVWDNLNVHLAAGMRQFIAGRDWLTVYQLPSYAPDLNPVEGIWSLLRRGWLSNTAFTTPEHLFKTIRHGLRTIQYRTHLIDGCLTGTGLSLTPATTRVQAQ